jgi:hypothetical protein
MHRSGKPVNKKTALLTTVKSHAHALCILTYLLTYLTGATTSLQLGPIEEDPSIALYLELGSSNLGPQGPGYR